MDQFYENLNPRLEYNGTFYDPWVPEVVRMAAFAGRGVELDAVIGEIQAYLVQEGADL